MSSNLPTPVRIALAGNPNSGKTSLFNAITGSNYKVANYPGVTVEKKEGKFELAADARATIVDLPGIYSLTGISQDEAIAANELLGVLDERHFDLVIVTIDSSNLERNLYLTLQLIDLGLPLIVALNMPDLAEERGIVIRSELLARQLGTPVVRINARRKQGISELLQTVRMTLAAPAVSASALAWANESDRYKEEAAELGKLALGDRSHLAPSAFSLYGAGLLSESFSVPDKVVQQALSESRKTLELENIDSYNFEASSRYRRINQIVKQSTSRVKAKPLLAQKIDPLLTHPVWGTVIFLAIMTIIFQSIFLWADLPMSFIDETISKFGSLIEPLIPPGKIRSLIIEGILAGVGSVLIFIPQIAILFFFLGALEDSAYLTRAAFLMDRLMRHVGLQGRSFIPLLSSFACAIPGIMATRTIPSFADRLATILIAPLMSCAARLPVYTVLIAAFVPKTKVAGIFSLQGIALFALYLLGIIGAAIVSFALKKTILRGEPSVFVMELPPFRRPSLRLVLRNVLDRIQIFVKDAGTVIFACSIILWALASYPQGEGHISNSYAGRIGHFIEPAIKPLGYNWEIGVGLIASFAAREVFISTLATIYSIEDQSEDNSSLVDSLAAKREKGEFSVATAISLLVFYVFACQCMATIAVVKRETSWRWATFMLAYMTLLAYGSAWSAYHLALIMNLG